ncbi:hypothetical protein [Winogradskyella sp. R77965]|uniref:hypothetical protein n=1 Tax=Winogradskyella sp. R77965 TaxID=3093872 RepID=UPI0037DC4672
MSDKLPQPPQNEEVDLGQLFNAIGKLFEKLFRFIGSIFKGIFSAIIYAIQPVVKHFKLTVSAMVIAAILGFILQKSKDPVYYSEMVVKPNFDSKYQLAKNIDYFNALIGSENLIELSNIFDIDTLSAKELVSFDLDVGPETQNDLFVEYDEYVMSIDTSLVDELSYVEYIKNRDLLSSRLFAIKAKSYKRDIFSNLEEGFRKTFENDFAKHQKKVRDTMAAIEREILKKQLARLDSIQKTYIEVKIKESEKGDLSLNLGNTMPLQEEKSETKEYELFQKEQEIGRVLTELEQEIAEENTYYDVLSGFDRVGIKDNSIKQRYMFLFPLLILGLFIFYFLVVKAFNYIKNYE